MTILHRDVVVDAGRVCSDQRFVVDEAETVVCVHNANPLGVGEVATSVERDHLVPQVGEGGCVGASDRLQQVKLSCDRARDERTARLGRVVHARRKVLPKRIVVLRAVPEGVQGRASKRSRRRLVPHDAGPHVRHKFWRGGEGEGERVRPPKGVLAQDGKVLGRHGNATPHPQVVRPLINVRTGANHDAVCFHPQHGVVHVVPSVEREDCLPHGVGEEQRQLILVVDEHQSSLKSRHARREGDHVVGDVPPVAWNGRVERARKPVDPPTLRVDRQRTLNPRVQGVHRTKFTNADARMAHRRSHLHHRATVLFFLGADETVELPKKDGTKHRADIGSRPKQHKVDSNRFGRPLTVAVVGASRVSLSFF
mmetsp:Transcript_12432/g.39301  ORF Transcript_12432/g.39301 Transcript_12432/m.39301 type:complete len:367 (-) Transcript_12432:271-1371(-)